jgi:ubiquinone/menaquinone biosynthesis C-methylase UbiE
MFDRRSNKKELLDDPQVNPVHLNRNLKELHTINSYLGGYRITTSALGRVLSPKKPAVVVDLGSGGGDTVLHLQRWSLNKKYSVQLKGIDINPNCVNYSVERCGKAPGIQFICDDYRRVKYHFPEADVLHASLFCHHLSDDEVVELLRFSKENRMTLVINDLQRHPLAYFAIRTLTAFFSRSHLVKHDAPLSVLRGFTTKEWVTLLQKAGVTKYSLRNRWAFRHELIVYND